MIYINEIKVGDKVRFNPPENSKEIPESKLKSGDIITIHEINKGAWFSERSIQKAFYQSWIVTKKDEESLKDNFIGEQGFSYLEKI